MPGLVAAGQDVDAEIADLLRAGGLRPLLCHADLGTLLRQDPGGCAAGDAEPDDQDALAGERLRPLDGTSLAAVEPHPVPPRARKSA